MKWSLHLVKECPNIIYFKTQPRLIAKNEPLVPHTGKLTHHLMNLVKCSFS